MQRITSIGPSNITFEEAKDRVFDQHSELFRQLAELEREVKLHLRLYGRVGMECKIPESEQERLWRIKGDYEAVEVATVQQHLKSQGLNRHDRRAHLAKKRKRVRQLLKKQSKRKK